MRLPHHGTARPWRPERQPRNQACSFGGWPRMTGPSVWTQCAAPSQMPCSMPASPAPATPCIPWRAPWSTTAVRSRRLPTCFGIAARCLCTRAPSAPWRSTEPCVASMCVRTQARPSSSVREESAPLGRYCVTGAAFGAPRRFDTAHEQLVRSPRNRCASATCRTACRFGITLGPSHA
jgi:hypothetical protein